nr:zinc finger protein 711-like [Aedes albopictus]
MDDGQVAHLLQNPPPPPPQRKQKGVNLGVNKPGHQSKTPAVDDESEPEEDDGEVPLRSPRKQRATAGRPAQPKHIAVKNEHKQPSDDGDDGDSGDFSDDNDPDYKLPAKQPKPQLMEAPKKMPTKKNKQVGKSVEPERHDCTECQFLTNLPWKLRVHIDRVHRKKHRYMCTDCDYGCYEKLVMERHMKMHNRAEPGPFPCPKCSFCTCRQSNLDYHLTHQHKDGHPIRKLKCSKCPKVCAD